EESGRAYTLEEARKYRQHRKIERARTDKVKAALGTRCMGCDVSLGEVYGAVADGYIEAHHLKPLSTYGAGERVVLDTRRDFAVLCANCHRVIHRMEDASDVQGLRAIIRRKPTS
ncbi:MAG: HNH endonuclease, partial [Caulobacterales bacterium]